MRTIICAVLVVLCLTVEPIVGHANPSVSAANAIVIEQQSGRTLFEHKSHDKQPIASITKLMTVIITVESGRMEEDATVSSRAVNTEGSSLYLEKGDKMRVEDLVYGMMLRSGNDAAVTLSEHIGGSVEGFVHLMNEKAAWLGMVDTHFQNPHGLHDKQHYSTAYDMAVLMRYAMDNETFSEISGTKLYQPDSQPYTWKNKNRLLTSLYSYCTGGKTGYTSVAGRTLVTTAHKNDMDLIAVTLNAPDDWNDHINMYEWSFDQYEMEDLNKKENQIPDLQSKGTASEKKAMTYPLTTKEQKEVTTQTIQIESDDVEPSITTKTLYYLNQQLIGKVKDDEKTVYKENRHSFSSLFKEAFKSILVFDIDG